MRFVWGGMGKEGTLLALEEGIQGPEKQAGLPVLGPDALPES